MWNLSCVLQNICSAQSSFLPAKEKEELLKTLNKAYEMIQSTAF